MDVIWPIEPKLQNGHRFHFWSPLITSPWVRAAPLSKQSPRNSVDFVHSNIICRFGIPKIIITDNAANLNCHLMKEVCEQLKIVHRHSTPYHPKANGVAEAANKEHKEDYQEDDPRSKQWHEKLPFALLGYRNDYLHILGATPYPLVYELKLLIPD
ncbi:PREDICTED: uncharacterized protein K02A2.6-like [Nicotiana attenuata]|uniref:uncharacterized protein K02A2.6-like n=1 Tax=Nicotiana attenuata TaxID=49451 RepID=UPI000905895F|nr:PREDICTED: uncharacterized protein K02A2.6-like [Nicotiana attenuata]